MPLLPASTFLTSQQVIGPGNAICGKKVLVKIDHWGLTLFESQGAATRHIFYLATPHTWWRISFSTSCAQKFREYSTRSFVHRHHNVGNNRPQECDKVRRHKLWKFQIKTILTASGLMNVTNETLPKPESTAVDYATWNTRNTKNTLCVFYRQQ